MIKIMPSIKAVTDLLKSISDLFIILICTPTLWKDYDYPSVPDSFEYDNK